MNLLYQSGLDVLGGDMGTGGAPSLPVSAVDFGPGLGTLHTDGPTIRAVQEELKARGYPPGPVDGEFGKKTEAALFACTGKHGPPDDYTLEFLGVKPGGAVATGGKRSSGSSASAAKAGSASAAGVPWYQTNVPYVDWPLWQAALAAVGVACLGVGVFSLATGDGAAYARRYVVKKVRKYGGKSVRRYMTRAR